MLAEHVFEHFTPEQLGIVLRQARRYLKPGGRIRFAVPDGNHPDPNYIDRVRPGGTGIGASDHKALYDSDSISELLGEAGYDVQLLEFFDGTGNFQRAPWRREDGYIGRSADNDARNVAGNLVYTSLIIDCWPRT